MIAHCSRAVPHDVRPSPLSPSPSERTGTDLHGSVHWLYGAPVSQPELFEMSDGMFQREGAFILAAERAAEVLEKRVRDAHSSVKVFVLTRDELRAIASGYARTACLARAYHLAESDRRAAVKRENREKPAA